MSLGELFVVLIIALLVMKPDDIPLILQKLQTIKAYIHKLKIEFFQYFEPEENFAKSLKEEADELNFYLKKIIDTEGNYDGDYSLNALKKRYNELLEDNIVKR